MRFKVPKCPQCGADAIGTVERVWGIAEFDPPDEDGTVEYSGYTRILWDSQTTESTANDATLLTCGTHEWGSDLLEPDTIEEAKGVSHA